MDSRSFDAIARSLAAPRSRRGLLGVLAALLAGRRGASAQPNCPPGQATNRKGQCTCPPGTDACPDGCYNRKSDPSNCGSCGNVCRDGATCRKGECRCPSGVTCSCPEGTLECTGSCVDTQTDSAHCGGCGNLCSAQSGKVCAAGTCQCAPGLVECFSQGTCRPSAEIGGDCFI